MRRTIEGLTLALVLLLAGTQTARAQEQLYVRVETNAPGGLVYADTLLVGSAVAGVLSVPAGAKALRLVPEGSASWSISPVVAPLDGEAGDTVSVRLHVPYHYRLESVPFGAVVYLEEPAGRTRLGETPLVYESEEPLEADFIVELPGYAPERIAPGRELWNSHGVVLHPNREVLASAEEVAWTPPAPRRRWIDYAAIGVAVVAGTVAVHYKFQADALYAEYEETGDPSLRPAIERLDRRSGVALGAMQAGVGVFALRLVLRR